jgi:hypothetical protein
LAYYMVEALVSCRNGPCRGYLLIYRSLFYIVSFLWHRTNFRSIKRSFPGSFDLDHYTAVFLPFKKIAWYRQIYTQSWAFATFFPFRYSLIRYFNVAIRYRYFSEICNTLYTTSFEQCNWLYMYK